MASRAGLTSSEVRLATSSGSEEEDFTCSRPLEGSLASKLATASAKLPVRTGPLTSRSSPATFQRYNHPSMDELVTSAGRQAGLRTGRPGAGSRELARRAMGARRKDMVLIITPARRYRHIDEVGPGLVCRDWVPRPPATFPVLKRLFTLLKIALGSCFPQTCTRLL